MRQALAYRALTQPMKSNPSRAQTSVGYSLPAPTGGWNAQNSLADMPETDAVVLDNWIPRAGYVEVRRGSQPWVTNFTNPVETLIPYRSSSDKIFAVSGSSIYDATAAGSVGSAAYSGLTNSRLQWTQFSNAAGAFVIAVNGADNPIKYTGSAWAVTSITASGGDPKDFIDVLAHKRRLFFVEKNSLHLWYLDVEAIAGPATLFDVGPIFGEGGTIECIGSWSLDGGQGQDDYLVIVTTEGEVGIYQGTDPNDANNWAQVGVFSIGRPLERRGLFKFGGDLQVLTTNGVLPLSQALNRDRAQDNDVAITAKIRNAWATASRLYGPNFGWQGFTYEAGQLAIYNIPTEEDVSAIQYVQNLQTGSWCSFSGLNAICWGVSEGVPYYGTKDTVYKWDVGVQDGSVNVVANMTTAYSTFRAQGRLKQFQMIRPVINSIPSVLKTAIGIQVDFEDTPPTDIPVTTIYGNSNPQITANWTSAAGIGYFGAIRLAVNLMVDPNLIGTISDGLGNDIVDQTSGSLIAVASTIPIDSSALQVISFDLIYQNGGQL